MACPFQLALAIGDGSGGRGYVLPLSPCEEEVGKDVRKRGRADDSRKRTHLWRGFDPLGASRRNSRPECFHLSGRDEAAGQAFRGRVSGRINDEHCSDRSGPARGCTRTTPT